MRNLLVIISAICCRIRRIRAGHSVLRHVLAFCIAGSVALAAGGAQAQSPPVRFAVIGDFGANLSYEGDVANLIHSWGVDFVITVGDNNYQYGQASTIDTNIGQYYHDFIYPYLGSYGAGATVNRFFPTLGNHDWGDGYVWPATVQPHTDYFALPGNERYYDVVWGPVHLFAVDSDEHEPDGDTFDSIQGQWLQQALASSTAPWKLVYFHYPPYTSASRGPVTWMRWPFAAWGASAVLSGHQHLYERLLESGFPYMINGLGGNYKDNFSSTPDPGSIVRYNGDYGAQLVTAYSDSINFQFITRAGMLVDSYTITATLPSAASGLACTSPSSTQTFLQWIDNSSIESGFNVYHSTDGQNFSLAGTTDANSTTFIDQGLTPGVTYYYVVRAFNANGEAPASNIASAEPTAVAADTPSNLTAQLTPPSTVSLSWVDNATDEAGYGVERSIDGVAFSQIAMTGPNTQSFTDSSLSSSSTYYYRVRLMRDVAGDTSNVAAVTTAPTAPSNLSITATTSARIDLTWSDQSPDETFFSIERSTDGTSFAGVGTVGTGVTSFSDTTVSASTSYWYRVRSGSGAGVSAPSNVVSTLTCPSAPTNMTATALSATKIQLTWQDNSTDELGFTIYRSTDGVRFAAIINVAANSTGYLNFGRNSGTNYWYKVRAYNATGYSDDSNTAFAATPPAPTSPPSAPTGLTATAISSSRIDLAWTDTSTTEDGFYVERSTDNKTWSQIVTLNPNVNTYSDTGRSSNRLYYYRVRAYNTAGNSAYSNVASATTFR